MLTEVEKKKEGPAVHLIPTKCLRDFTSEVIPHENATTNISKKIGTSFLKYQNTHIIHQVLNITEFGIKFKYLSYCYSLKKVTE